MSTISRPHRGWDAHWQFLLFSWSAEQFYIFNSFYFTRNFTVALLLPVKVHNGDGILGMTPLDHRAMNASSGFTAFSRRFYLVSCYDSLYATTYAPSIYNSTVPSVSQNQADSYTLLPGFSEKGWMEDRFLRCMSECMQCMKGAVEKDYSALTITSLSPKQQIWMTQRSKNRTIGNQLSALILCWHSFVEKMLTKSCSVLSQRTTETQLLKNTYC